MVTVVMEEMAGQEFLEKTEHLVQRVQMVQMVQTEQMAQMKLLMKV